ncbi:MCP four helix bundle domain-containing protein [Undibacterium sp. CCC3.4]|nr:MCP four helix bundle domain-containing protein [Undibacterium sp. CCC3.4]MEB0217279.1 MCP four helix bundle domain-containing protein [Undibacterium sp. 5I2]WPX44145.1 MCP four helix bundle domain-containing protein [Undibacterium sp. CCC3.4]
MQWFYNLKISAKLLASFGVVLLLMLMMGISAIFAMGRINQSTADLAHEWMPSVRIAMSLRTDLAEMRRWELAHLLSDDETAMAAYEKRMDQIQAASNADRSSYEKLISGGEERHLVANFDQDWTIFITEHPKVIS